MLTPPDILQLANSGFIKNLGVIISGSQRNNEILKKESDIDVIVLDPASSSQWHLLMEKEGYRVEFIVLPAFDLDNIIDNDLYEPKNGLLSLAQGKILSDPQGIAAPFLQKAENYFNTVQFKTNADYNKFLVELMKLRPQFDPALSPAERYILLSDFISIITQLETIRVSNWNSKTKHKLVNLKTKSPDFLEKLSSLFEKGLTGQFEEIVSYINFYHYSYTQLHLSSSARYKQLVIEIGYPDFTLTGFVNDILPSLINSPDMAEMYQYFYLSSLKYSRKYKHKVCIAFSIVSQEEGLKIYSTIQEKITMLAIPALQFDYFCEGDTDCVDSSIFQPLRSAVNKAVVTEIAGDNDFDTAKSLHLLFRCIYYTKIIMELAPKDFQKINAFIGQKYILTNEEQQQAANPQIRMKLINAKMQEAEASYKLHMPYILQLVMLPQNDFFTNNDDANKVLNCIKDAVSFLAKQQSPENIISFHAMKAIQLDNPGKGWQYQIIIEALLLVTNLSDNEKYNALFSSAKGVADSGV